MKTRIYTRVLTPSSAPIANIAWWLSKNNYGIFSVDLTKEAIGEPNEKAVIAELVVLRFLIEERLSGKSPELSVSKGAIRRVLRKKSSMPTAWKYAAFLRTKHAGVPISVEKGFKPWDACGIDAKAAQHVPLAVTPEDRHPAHLEEIDGIGKVGITEHALERFESFFPKESGGINKPYKSLLKRLENPRLLRYAFPPNVKLHKTQKYGAHKITEVWGHMDWPELLIMALDPTTGIRTLVTTTIPTNARRHELRIAGRKHAIGDHLACK